MKRTPLKRKTPLKTGKGLRAKKPMAKRAKPKASYKGPWRSVAYLRWVKSLRCCKCGRPADDPHHIIGTGGMGGAGTKAPDYMVMPVCRPCHDEIHATPELWPEQYRWVHRTLHTASLRPDAMPVDILERAKWELEYARLAYTETKE